MNVYVEPESLIESYNKMKLVIGELKNIFNRIETFVASINGEWQGNAEKVFSGKIMIIRNQYSDIECFYNDCAELIKEISDSYEEQDVNTARLIELI